MSGDGAPRLGLPQLSLVVLIGAFGSGKSTFARRHFLPTEVISSDACRAMLADDENDQAATKPAFELLRFIAGQRLAGGRLTVVDATSVKREDRLPLVKLAREHHVLPVAIVFDLPERVCQDRNAGRPDRDYGPHVVRNHVRALRRSLRGLRKEGFRHVHVLRSPEEADAAVVERQPLWNDRRSEHGPFDVIGDVHGCADELEELLAELGYARGEERPGEFPDGGPLFAHPAGRTAVFLGDLVDRGPRSLDVVRLVRNMVEAGSARCVPGNHDVRLVRKLRGRDVKITHGLDRTLDELAALPEERRAPAEAELVRFLDSLVSHYVFDDGRLVVAHAGMKEEMQGRGSGQVRDFALFGETTGETDEFGLPVRYDWALEYRGEAMVVYGHTPVPEPAWLNRTINVDTGCVFGGRLTALRYPEEELVSVAARGTYAEPVKPFLPEPGGLTEQQRADDLLDIEDVIGKRIVATRLARDVTVGEEQAAAALELMGRFAIDPKWLVYLPPAVSPAETSGQPDLLEHPGEAIAYYRGRGVAQVICEEKHMGSRAVAVVCRDADAARRRFGVVDGPGGALYTRTGRRFFHADALEGELLDRVRSACEAIGLFERLASDWLVLDCELMPWSAKAQELVRAQFAAVGAAARAALPQAVAALERAAGRGVEAGEALERYRGRALEAEAYVEAYRRYCWPVGAIDDLALAPFHLMASEGAVHVDKDHRWHMAVAAELAEADSLLRPTAHRIVDTVDPASEAEAVAWWQELTGAGGEGFVVKPVDFVVHGPRGVVQPALKIRGREYLRIVYGPEYTEPANLERLRSRRLGRKRSLAGREFALGVEALERFTRGEPLRRVHECCFAVLALESEPVDPRL